MIAYTDDASNRILQTYVPILPKHIWGKKTYTEIGDDKLWDLPADGSGLVGTGPYQAVEWKTGEHVRFKKNPYWRGKPLGPDEIIIQFFGTNETMVQALKAGEIDYAHNVSPEQLNQLKTEPNIKTVNGVANGWTELGFNTYGTGTGKTIKGGGPSTKALLDQKFRDALGYAIDKQKLIDNVIGGYGTIGTTQIPPAMPSYTGEPPWHTDPTNPRTFDIELAKQKLTRRGLPPRCLGQSPRQGRQADQPRAWSCPTPIRPMPSPASSSRTGSRELGIKVSPTVLDSDTLGDRMLPPEAGEGKTAKYDLFIWDWAWGPDPNDPLERLPVQPDRLVVRQPVLRSRVRQALPAAAGREDPRGAQGDPRPDAADVVRGRSRITSSTTTTISTPTGPTSGPAGRTSRRTGRRSSATGRSPRRS